MENEKEKQLLEEIRELRIRLNEAEEAFSAIRGGGVDAIVVSGSHGEQVFTLTGVERAYRVLIETMNEGAASLNREGMIMYCNQRLAEMIKTPLEKVIGAPMRQFIRASDLPVFDSLIGKGVQESGKGEVALINSDGILLPVLLSVSSIQTDNENICGITVTDLTAQKHIESELRRHRDHLEELVKDRTNELQEASELNRQVIESAQEGIIVYGPDLKYRIWNSFMERFTGLPAGEVLGRHPLDVFPFLLEAGVVAGIEKALAGEACEPKRYQFHVPKTGRSGWVSEISAPLKNANGKIVGVIDTVRDVTEHVRDEEFMLASAREWAEAFDAINDMITIHDADFNIVRANKASESALGLAMSDILTQKCFKSNHGSDNPPDGCTSCKSLKTGVPSTTELFEPHLKKFVEIKAMPRFDAQHNIIGVVQIVRDITEHRKLEAQLRQSQKMEAVGQLAGGVAHDFNNILSAIFGYSQLSLMKLQENDPVKEYVEQILKASERAAVLTQSLLALSRKQEVNLVVIDLSSVVKAFEIFLQRLIREDIELKVNCSKEPLAVMADRGQIEQVIMNLVANGRDAMQNGGKLLIDTVSVTLDQEFVETHGYGTAGVYAVISVSDSGIGMDKETQARIFEPFYTTKEQGKGTGLGLSMAYGIIKKHDGFINIYSEPGRGTIFKIYLPLVSEVAKADKAWPDVSIALRGGTETILVCEDDAVLRKLAVKVLSHFGYRVIEAMDGQDAIEKFVAHKESIDLVFIDAIMPKKNGREACQEMRTGRPGLKAIFASGYALDIFADGIPIDEKTIFISKPFSPADLLTNVRELLDKK